MSASAVSSPLPDAQRTDVRAARTSGRPDTPTPEDGSETFTAQLAQLAEQAQIAPQNSAAVQSPANEPANSQPTPQLPASPLAPNTAFALSAGIGVVDAAPTDPTPGSAKQATAAPSPTVPTAVALPDADEDASTSDGQEASEGDADEAAACATAQPPIDAPPIALAPPVASVTPASPPPDPAVAANAAAIAPIAARGAKPAQSDAKEQSADQASKAAPDQIPTGAPVQGQTAAPTEPPSDGQHAVPPTEIVSTGVPTPLEAPAPTKGTPAVKPPELKAADGEASAPASASSAEPKSAASAAEPTQFDASAKRIVAPEVERTEGRTETPAPTHARAATGEGALQQPDATTIPSVPAQTHSTSATAPALPDAARAQVQTQPATPLPMVPIAIGLQALEGAREFQIRLDPDDLGRVDVKLTIADDGRVAASLTVDRVDTLAMLQRDARTLERAFDQAGFTSDSDSLKFSLRQDQTGQQQGGERRDAAPTPSPVMRQIQIEAPVDAPIPQWRAPSAIGGVDIRI